MVQFIENNWRTGHHSIQRIACRSEASKGVYCLQYDDQKIISGLRDNTIKVFVTGFLALFSSVYLQYLCFSIPPLRLWNMGLDQSSRRQDRRLWQLLPPTYPTDSLHSSCYQCWCTTPSQLPTTAAAAHPNKMAPFLWACGTDERLPRHFQSPTYVDPRAAQGLETPPRMSTSHLASDPKCRTPPAQPRTQLSMATCPGHRTMEATRGNGYAPA